MEASNQLSSGKSAAELHHNVDVLCDEISNHFFTTLAAASGPPETETSRAAQNELGIADESAALVYSTQRLSSLIKDLQTHWFFGRLDTIADLGDEQANREKALNIAAAVETVVKKGVARKEVDGEHGAA